MFPILALLLVVAMIAQVTAQRVRDKDKRSRVQTLIWAVAGVAMFGYWFVTS